LSAVIDFGGIGVGDPACDLAIAWTFFSGESRRAFRAGLPMEPATWARGRGWALWKALITPRDAVKEGRADESGRRFGWRHGGRRVIEEVLADHRAGDTGAAAAGTATESPARLLDRSSGCRRRC
jgi:aminoglycoside phosphotransferase (APT) family kinase protein